MSLDIIEKIALLPPWLKYKNATYQLQIFNNNSSRTDIRICYAPCTFYDWEDGYPNFLFLIENISNQWGMNNAIEHIEMELITWLIENPQ